MATEVIAAEPLDSKPITIRDLFVWITTAVDHPPHVFDHRFTMLRLALTSRLAGLRRRWNYWLGGGPASLDKTQEIQTISDHVDTTDLTQWLPDQWDAAIEIVQFQGEPLAQVIRLINQRDGARITLKPVDMQTPTGAVEIYTRSSSQSARSQRETADSLSTGLTEATQLAVALRWRPDSDRDHRHTDNSQQRGHESGSEILFAQQDPAEQYRNDGLSVDDR